MLGGKTGGVQPERRTLVPNKLNVVGENHAESKLRREDEKKFTKAISNNYWTEAEFPDLHQKMGSRKPRIGSGQGDPAADLMEFRAAHGAAILIVRFEKLAAEAGSLVAKTPVSSALAAIYAFVNESVRKFQQDRDRIAATWRQTTTTAVNRAAEAVYTNVESALQTYFTALRNAPPETQLKATKTLADTGAAVRDLVPPLEEAVGVPRSPNRNADALARDMRTQRSGFMLYAASISNQIGVWKVGDLHVADLLNGTVRVDTSQINVVTKEDFDAEFEAWQHPKPT
jgi:hypothetical protein